MSPPVVLLVSAFSMDDEIRSKTAGKVFRYLQKPVAPGQLIEAVSDAMSESEARSAARPAAPSVGPAHDR